MSFDSLKNKLEKEGHSADSAKKIAGKVAWEKCPATGCRRESISEEDERVSECRKLVDSIMSAKQESGSDEIRGKNQAKQLRAMMWKDPEGAPTRHTGKYRTKGGKRLGGYYG